MKLCAIALSVILVALSFLGCGKTESVDTSSTNAVTPAPATNAAPPTGAVASGSAAPTTTTVAAPPAVGSSNAIASADGEQSGVRAEVTELRRSSGGTVNLKFTIINDSSEAVSFGYNFVEKDKGYGDIGGVHLIDQVGKKKYFVARDSEGNCACSRDLKDLPAGERRNLWAKFPAPPSDVKKISIVIPRFSPLDDVPVAE